MAFTGIIPFIQMPLSSYILAHISKNDSYIWHNCGVPDSKSPSNKVLSVCTHVVSVHLVS